MNNTRESSGGSGEKRATWESGYRPDQCGYKEDDSPVMFFVKYTISKDEASVTYQLLKP